MKSNVRKLAALLLTAVLILAPLTLAYGYKAGDTIEWKYNFSDNLEEITYKYTCLGAAKIGKQTLTEAFTGFVFTPKSNGYYLVSVRSNPEGDADIILNSWDISESLDKDGAHNSFSQNGVNLFTDSGTADEPDMFYYGICCYFKAGKSYFIGTKSINGSSGKATLEIQKSGAPVSVQLSNPNKTYVIGYDIYYYSYDKNTAILREHLLKIKFSNSETYYTYDVNLKGKVKTGTCNLTATLYPDDFGNYKFYIKIKCIDVKDRISKIEYIGNIDNAVKYYYNGAGPGKNGITDIRVTYKNGKSETFPVTPIPPEYNFDVIYYTYITIDGSEVSANIILGTDDKDGSCCLMTNICDNNFGKTKVDVADANFFENIGRFIETTKQYLGDIHFGNTLKESPFLVLSQIFNEVKLFTAYLFAIPRG